MQRHDFHASVLREYDIRGVVGDTLTPADAYAVGRGFATVVLREGGQRLCAGYDGRLSSPEFEAALVDGMTDAGAEVLRVGRGPTPMLYFAVYHLQADGGVMVTGSHNPPDYNGFKITRGPRAFYGAAIQQLGRAAAAGDWLAGPGRADAADVQPAYVARLCEAYGAGLPLDVAWDCGNGAAGDVTRALVAQLPGRHVLLNDTVDGAFPAHHPDPTVPENLRQLQAAVTDQGLAAGIAFDGDGDRLGVIDGQGRILWGDQILALLARDLLAERPGSTVIADVKASQVLFDEIAAAGGKPLMYRTGHSLIKDKMAETGAPLAGEMSGHLFFADRYYGFDDALYAAVRLLDAVARSGRDLASLRDSLPQAVSTPEIRFDCPDDRKFQVIAEVRGRLLADGAELNDIDGVRVSTADGWWLLRASNTQPVLVARCEARDGDGLGRLKQAVRGALADSGIDAPADF